MRSQAALAAQMGRKKIDIKYIDVRFSLYWDARWHCFALLFLLCPSRCFLWPGNIRRMFNKHSQMHPATPHTTGQDAKRRKVCVTPSHLSSVHAYRLIHTPNLVFLVTHTLHPLTRPHPPCADHTEQTQDRSAEESVRLPDAHTHTVSLSLLFSSTLSVCSSLSKPHSSLYKCGHNMTPHGMLHNAPL